MQQGALCKPWVGVFLMADTWILENNRGGCCQGSVAGHENEVTQSSSAPCRLSQTRPVRAAFWGGEITTLFVLHCKWNHRRSLLYLLLMVYFFMR